MKKGFYEKYVKDNRTEDEKMMDIIHDNYKKTRQTVRNGMKEEKKKNRVMFVLMAIALVLSFMIGQALTGSAVNDCVSGGHSENWCIKNL